MCGDVMDCLRELPAQSINTCITSPPYFGLRDYGINAQIGLEESPEEYITKLVEVFREVRRVLRDDGTVWLNLGDCYTNNSTPGGGDPTIGIRNIGKSKYSPTKIEGIPPKNLLMIPARVALALQKDGWYLRQDIIWAKPNPMPESVRDRCTKSHEYIFLLSKSKKYYYDHEAIKEPAVTTDSSIRDRDGTRLNNTPGRTRMGGLKTNHYTTRNKRDVWTVATRPYKGAHFAVYPEQLIEPCVLAGCPEGGMVLDPFGGSGTTGVVALKNNCNITTCELNPEYFGLLCDRIMGALT